jgi:hypothetical protein
MAVAMEISSFLQNNVATILRILIDAYILSFAYRKSRVSEISVADTFEHHDEVFSFFTEGESASKKLLAAKNIGFHMISAGSCEIDHVRIFIHLSELSQHKIMSPYAYIDLSGRGAFQAMLIRMPFKIQGSKFGSDDIGITLDEDEMGLILSDFRNTPLPNEQFKISVATPVMLRGHTDWGSIKIELPIRHQLRMVGQPWMKGDSMPNFKAEPGDPDNYYFPSIQAMEIGIYGLPDQYRFSRTELAPPPEFRSESECRWISGCTVGSRPHSSVFFQLDKEGAEPKMELARIRGGFSVGLWTAVFVTVAIDLTWSSVDLIGAIANKLNIVN